MNKYAIFYFERDQSRAYEFQYSYSIWLSVVLVNGYSRLEFKNIKLYSYAP